MVYSFLGYLLSTEPDWRMKTQIYEFPSMPGSHQYFRLSDPAGSTQFDFASLQTKLRGAGNVFAGRSIDTVHSHLQFPPNTKVTIEKGAVTIASPPATIRFSVQPGPIIGGIPKFAPGGGLEITEQGSGQRLYLVTMLLSLTVSRIHSQNHEISAYREWFDRIVSGARDWFRPVGANL
jgi:hypothetical protein